MAVSDPTPDPKPMTPAEMRKQAERLDAEIERVQADADAEIERLRARAAQLRQTADAVERLSGIERVLTSTKDSTSNSTMSQPAIAVSTEETRALARGKGRSKARRQGHKFVLALYDKGMTMTSWAEKHDVSLASVAAWVTTSRKGGRRRIPMRYALKIQQEFGLPATVETWPNGITE